ncbi:MAG: very short patch repair endonuclease [Treponema sp.]|nr:very short patch repair endonuclease [Treponema sp.]
MTRKIISAIKSKDVPGIFFRKTLWKLGIRYRKNVKLFGKPDIAIKNTNCKTVAVRIFHRHEAAKSVFKTLNGQNKAALYPCRFHCRIVIPAVNTPIRQVRASGDLL